MAKSRPSGAARKADADSGLLREKIGNFIKEPFRNSFVLDALEDNPALRKEVINDFRNDIKKYAKRFSGENSIIENRQTGQKISISQGSIGEATNGVRQLEELEALRSLPGMLKRAKYVGPEPNLKAKQGVKQFHVFEMKRKIWGRNYDFKIKVIERTNGTWFYDSYVKK